ncbi:hypothetical protein K9B32_16405 [Rhizobium sp. 3T7]|uniref:hypothetical protein n=1 Tax=Rhizobium sp. 3T7 TaxID=2874922 RepID=UPI001CCD28EF|nr:hypothetical protein [Rhizobium sp. 3T7]MBZ9791688.1 hypothetical protein [Rhizobium sp. 3T7]
MGNVHFVRSTQVGADEVLHVDGLSVWENCAVLFRRIEAICGEGASSVFAEPNVKPQGSGGLVVAWFGGYDDDPKPLDALDRAMNARVEADLSSRLAALRPALADADIGETVAAMINIYDASAIMAVGEHAILTNWGVLPRGVVASQAGFARHSEATIGPYLKSGVSPAVPGQSWRITGGMEAVGASPPSQPRAPAAAPAPMQTVVVERTGGVRLLPPLLLSAIFASALAYVAWPGSLIYERNVPPDQAAQAGWDKIRDDLAKRASAFETALSKPACEAKDAWVEASLGIPAPAAAAAPDAAQKSQQAAEDAAKKPAGDGK